jgi:hydrogenase maturation protease
MENNTVVLGLGNTLMHDEGIGVVLIRHFQSHSADFPHVEFIEASTGGLSILHFLAGKTKAVLIDCAQMNTVPGTIKRFEPEDIESIKELTHYSLHEVDIMKVIEMAKQLGQCPDEVIIFGIEPEKIELAEGISDTLKSRIYDYIAFIAKDLQ